MSALGRLLVIPGIGRLAFKLLSIKAQYGIRRAWGHMAVTFTAPDGDVARLNIERGPTLPLPDRSKALASRYEQFDGRPEDYDMLLSLIQGVHGTHWAEQRREGRGQLWRISPPYVAALAQIARDADELVQRAGTVGEIYLDISERWRLAVNRQPMHRTSFRLALSSAAHKALRAEELGQGLYVWFGPDAPPGISARSRARLEAEVGEQVASRDIARR